VCNLFVQRLKHAKRELTALKTACQRGLGTVKIYSETAAGLEVGHTSGSWAVTITANLDQAFAAYPFMMVVPQVDSSFAYSLEVTSMQYEDSGYTAKFKANWKYDANAGGVVTIYSTSPIDSVSFSWSQN